MLLLSRKIGEIIKIGDDISIIILDIHGKQIKIGIEAPKSIAVHREEIYQKIKAEDIAHGQIKEKEASNNIGK